MKRLLTLFFLAFSFPAFAQGPIITQPVGTVSYNASSTIAVTNTFQSIWVASDIQRGRTGCTVINYGSNTMWVYFGPIASATKAASIQLAVGQAVYCNNGGIILKDQVSITGTSGEAFFAATQ